ncbi:MAG: hypothetical protein KJ947_07840 [Alphaproteobacteria bacterium]|jgi:hypothetical protein|uniref:Methyltransferase FkbM domain-containing protein n=1 Tax=viral metagenome TaxID=1070528 RepID=A0A6M3XC05_9ZZZZ|nr:hypothetical protein [Alphaproteobacteria bacterium]MBU1549471.1 hypothetical protein [Alphaproteobacteria bacterium]MBU2336992.1 hypothetical protein [Alphaproteobacteria bacterium]MBU2391431.1 hypothetical protein [Alphaproteobacteria bacterium]|tara:strand:- start:133 stop:1002 length:870 start_codon:yes stop_codon:yes gene_type:complete
MTTRVISQRLTAEYELHKRNVFSQTGEDGIIEYFTKKIGVEAGYFVEFGAWDGKHLSNCAYLAQKGWSGCFIEGDSERFLDLVSNYGDNDRIAKLNRFVMPQGEDSLDFLLPTVGAPSSIDVLSIDIDGYDYAVWEQLKRHLPRLVVVEYNPTISANVVYIQDEHDQTCFGNSLAAFWELALSKGYRLVATTDWNAFFLSEQDCREYGIPDYAPWELHDNKFETYLFHGYNGQVKLAGDQTIVWHGVNIPEQKVQILPKSLQKIPVGQPDEFFTALAKFKEDPANAADK